jgi:hypothetical protein
MISVGAWWNSNTSPHARFHLVMNNHMQQIRYYVNSEMIWKWRPDMNSKNILFGLTPRINNLMHLQCTKWKANNWINFTLLNRLPVYHTGNCTGSCRYCWR